MSDDTKKDRLMEAAMALLQSAPGGQLNIVLLNKALFYLDLAALRDTGETLTGATYVAIENGPVIARYQERLVRQLEKAGLARQETDGRARPIHAIKSIAEFKYLDASLLSLAEKVARWVSDWTSVGLSVRSHKNPGWQIAWESGLKQAGKAAQPIDMSIALQEFSDDDEWLAEPLSAELAAEAAKADDDQGEAWE